MGVPVVLPSKTPDIILTSSASRRAVVNREVPGLRRSRSCCRSASLSSSPGGQPSIIAPKPNPWLSPNEVTVNNLPKVLPDIVILTCKYYLAKPSNVPSTVELLVAGEVLLMLL